MQTNINSVLTLWVTIVDTKTETAEERRNYQTTNERQFCIKYNYNSHLIMKRPTDKIYCGIPSLSNKKATITDITWPEDEAIGIFLGFKQTWSNLNAM